MESRDNRKSRFEKRPPELFEPIWSEQIGPKAGSLWLRPRRWRQISLEAGQWSGREALVPVMKATDLGKGNDLPGTHRQGRSPVWCILGQRQVRSGTVVIVEVRGQFPTKMLLVHDDNVVEALASD